MQHPQAVNATEVVFLKVSAGGKEVGAAKGQLMSGGVRPRRPWFSHNEALAQQFHFEQ
jgi:hypothetical protein